MCFRVGHGCPAGLGVQYLGLVPEDTSHKGTNQLGGPVS